MNQFYVALGKGALQYQASYTGHIGGENGEHFSNRGPHKTRKIASFSLEKSNDDTSEQFEIIPTDENGNTFSTSLDKKVGMNLILFGAAHRDLRDQMHGFDVTANGKCNSVELESTFAFFAQALRKLHKLRTQLQETQETINRENTATSRIESIQKSVANALKII